MLCVVVSLAAQNPLPIGHPLVDVLHSSPTLERAAHVSCGSLFDRGVQACMHAGPCHRINGSCADRWPLPPTQTAGHDTTHPTTKSNYHERTHWYCTCGVTVALRRAYSCAWPDKKTQIDQSDSGAIHRPQGEPQTSWQFQETDSIWIVRTLPDTKARAIRARKCTYERAGKEWTAPARIATGSCPHCTSSSVPLLQDHSRRSSRSCR